MMYVSQLIMLYILDIRNARCQLYLNKTGRKKSLFAQNDILLKY